MELKTNLLRWEVDYKMMVKVKKKREKQSVTTNWNEPSTAATGNVRRAGCISFI